MSKKQSSLRRNARDFTGGSIFGLGRNPGSTGDSDFDQKVAALVAEFGCGESSPLIEELIITSLKMGKDQIDEGDLKLYNRALKEHRESSNVFGPYDKERKISIFGSARTKPEEPEYQAAKAFAERMREEGFMGITGAGPGIMEAGNEGSGRDYSFGLNIQLPFEAEANQYILGDEKLIDYNYFFTRKLAFVKESDAVAAFPGGFGTMDEIFETLTLMQTGKCTVFPIVLVDAPGGTYWKTWLQFVKDHLFRLRLISEEDFNLFIVTDDLDEAVEEVTSFYKNFHSYRYLKDKMIIRVQKEVTDSLLADLKK
ncbi:MAG: LOG family protein, partial [Verrucomicrobiota bacterium]